MYSIVFPFLELNKTKRFYNKFKLNSFHLHGFVFTTYGG